MMEKSKEYSLIEGLQQEYHTYSVQDHETWNKLFSRQVEHLKGRAFSKYFDCLEELQPCLNASAIPNYNDLNSALLNKTNWSIHVVPGLISVEDFFDLLSRRKFSASTWIRKPEQLDYIEEPDMFHDVFGHVPLLMDPDYANFMQSFGEMGASLRDNPKLIVALQRLYWFSIEFGLIKEGNDSKIYGAGIISSYGEVEHVLKQLDQAISFDLQLIYDHDFKNDEIQNDYYLLDSLDQMISSFQEWKLNLGG